jgi:hypothetical protein
MAITKKVGHAVPDQRKVQTVRRVQFRATVDVRTVKLMSALIAHLRLKRSPLIAKLSLELITNKKEQAAFKKFYQERWPELQQLRRDVGLQFNWPIEVDDALRVLSWEAVGTGNKSETLRVVVAYFANKNGVVVSA